MYFIALAYTELDERELENNEGEPEVNHESLKPSPEDLSPEKQSINTEENEIENKNHPETEDKESDVTKDDKIPKKQEDSDTKKVTIEISRGEFYGLILLFTTLAFLSGKSMTYKNQKKQSEDVVSLNEGARQIEITEEKIEESSFPKKEEEKNKDEKKGNQSFYHKNEADFLEKADQLKDNTQCLDSSLEKLFKDQQENKLDPTTLFDFALNVSYCLQDLSSMIYNSRERTHYYIEILLNEIAKKEGKNILPSEKIEDEIKIIKDTSNDQRN